MWQTKENLASWDVSSLPPATHKLDDALGVAYRWVYHIHGNNYIIALEYEVYKPKFTSPLVMVYDANNWGIDFMILRRHSNSHGS